LESTDRQKLSEFIEKWIKEKINLVLKSLIDLKNLRESNSSIKALAYQLYESNGVIKREAVTEYLKKLGQNERKILRELGVKFGRYLTPFAAATAKSKSGEVASCSVAISEPSDGFLDSKKFPAVALTHLPPM